MTQRNLVLQVGRTTRDLLEYLQPNTDWGSSLCGACAVGSWINQRLLANMHRIHSHFFMGNCEGSGHCWVELLLEQELYVLDVTATQFGMRDRVLLQKREDYDRHSFIKNLISEEIDDEAFETLGRAWPEDQRPETYFKQIKTYSPDLYRMLMQ